jgi:hypothetical protein
MEPNKSPIWGREIVKRWQAKGWAVDEFILLKLIEDFDLVATGGDGNPLFIDGAKDSEDHILGVYAYCFDRNIIELFEKESHDYIERLILKHEIDNGGLNAVIFPRGRDPKKLNRCERRLSNINSILDKGGLEPKERTYLFQKKDDVEKEIKRLRKLLPAKKELREDQEDKKEVQEIATSLWYDKKLKIRIKEMSNRPEIKMIVGKRYQPQTVHRWLSEVAPKFAKYPGRPKKRKQT